MVKSTTIVASTTLSQAPGAAIPSLRGATHRGDALRKGLAMEAGRATSHLRPQHATSAALAIAAIVLVALDLRPGIVSVGPILPAIIDEFGLSHAKASLLVSIPDVLMGALALPTPWLARRLGRDPVVLTALALLFCSMLARAFAASTWQLLACTVGVGAGIAVTGALLAGFIKARFPNRAAVMMGIYATALSLGSTISAAVTGPVAQTSGGWRLAAGLWAGLGVFAMASWLLVSTAERRRRPAEDGPLPVHRLPLGNRTAWLIAVYFACINFLFYALLSWTVPMYREAGLSPAVAGLALATFTGVFMCATLIFGWLSKSHDRRGWLALCAALGAIGLAAIALAPTTYPFLAVACCAIGLGGAFTLGMTLPLDNTADMHEANVWNAFVLTVGYLVAAAGPLLVGYLRDVEGGFGLPFTILIAVAVIMLAVSPFLQPHRPSTSAAL
jgi:MFS transporter, CP family, cyanate transporter